MFKQKGFIIFLICVLCISGCNVRSRIERNEVPEIEENPEKLVVYLSAAPHGFQSRNDPNGENIDYYYPSKYIVGTRMVGGELDCEGGNIFEQALIEYTEKTGIQIEVHYIEEYGGESDILQELYIQDELPDLILLNKHSQYDYYKLANQGLLLDFSLYADEDLYNEELYYQNVIKGGRIEDEQVILPVLFNMNGMIVSSSFLTQIGCENLTENVTYDEILYLLQESCVEMSDLQTKEAIFEASGLMVGGRYIPSIMVGAAYSTYFDSDFMNLEISAKVVTDILELMQLYNRQEFGIDQEWDKKTYFENLNNDDIKSALLTSLEPDAYDQVGIFLSGGRSGGINFHNSLLMDAAYFNSMYKKNGDEMMLYGIPTAKNSQKYAANITVLAAGLSTTKHPEAVYELARYLMDYEYPTAYGFSVNKLITEKQLENIQKTTTKLYSDTIWSDVVGGRKTKEKIETEIELIEPLDAHNVEKIRYMLDNMEGAGLPFGILEYHILNVALRKTADGEMTCGEAGEWVINTLDEYLKVGESLEPFYDQEYIESLYFD